MKSFMEALKQYLEQNPPSLPQDEDGTVLGTLYGVYSENTNLENSAIKAGFRALYQQMHGTPLWELDKVIDPVCALCREHERSGFVEGVKVGYLLRQEVEQ